MLKVSKDEAQFVLDCIYQTTIKGSDAMKVAGLIQKFLKEVEKIQAQEVQREKELENVLKK
tara:strand:- start:2654 stop:2836 length:183 start_codon:yes stop_codon:yes gene_type:complete